MAHPSQHLFLHHLSTQKNKKFIHFLAYVVGIGGNAAVLPQILKAWQGSAPGLSVLTWLLFIFIGIIWLIYAIIHNSKPLIVAQLVGISCNFLVVAGWAFNHLYIKL